MLDNILKTCLDVERNGNHVKINYDKIDILIEELKMYHNEHYLLSNPFDILDLNIEDLVNFLLLYDAVDFSFWGNPKWSVEYNGKLIDGGFALLCVLLRFFKENKESIFDKIYLMEEPDFKSVFTGVGELPLLNERINILKNISKIVIEKMNKNFYLAIQDKTTDYELFQFIIEAFPSFQDERDFKGKTIYFYKLAQLLTSDILHMRAYYESIPVSYTSLIGCSDYKIPQVLRNLGILEYSNALASIVDAKKELDENSEYEVEIRANTLAVINYIYEVLDKKIARIDINDFIWLKGKVKSESDKPYHLTRTMSY